MTTSRVFRVIVSLLHSCAAVPILPMIYPILHPKLPYARQGTSNDGHAAQLSQNRKEPRFVTLRSRALVGFMYFCVRPALIPIQGDLEAEVNCIFPSLQIMLIHSRRNCCTGCWSGMSKQEPLKTRKKCQKVTESASLS
jgi:hypothetical protein